MIGIISVGLSNLSSIRNAIDTLGFESILIESAELVSNASKIIIPGVGSFYEAMTRLRDREMDVAIKEVVSGGVPILGICLGMHLLADKGSEGGEIDGLGLISGNIKKMSANHQKLPHLGWNNLVITRDNEVLEKKYDNVDFFFIHSYEFIAHNQENVIATTEHGESFASVIANKHIYGFQFHPEKSQRAGMELLKSFIVNA